MSVSVRQAQSVAPIAPFWSASTWRTIALGSYLAGKQADRHRRTGASLPSIFPIEMVLERVFSSLDLRSELRLIDHAAMSIKVCGLVPARLDCLTTRDVCSRPLHPPSARQACQELALSCVI